jgi:2-dehydropantoate 2-reductase
VELADGDVVVLTMKSQDTPAALAALIPLAPPPALGAGIALVCAQNGVENERLALRSFADVYGLNVICPASHLEPGVVVAHSLPVNGLFDLGCYPSGVDATAEAVAGALRSAGFESEARPDIMRWKYRKLMLNLVNVALAVCDESPELPELVRVLRAEGAAALAAAGIDMVGIEEDQARRQDRIVSRDVAGVPRGGGSTWQSLVRGTGSVETDYLTGEVVLLGRLHGVPTPASELLQRLAHRAAAERLPPGHLTAAEVLAQLG